MPKILLVDDDPAIRTALARLVAFHGHAVSQAENAADGIAAIARMRPDLVITDMEMPGGSGFTVLTAGLAAGVPVVILTAHATVALAVEAMRRGAANFLTKPFTAETVAEVLKDEFSPRSPAARAVTLAPAAAIGDNRGGIPAIGDDEAFRRVLAIVDKVATTDATVLITGESGTGKEVVARAIHVAGRRRDNPFVAVNCGGIPEALLESELFGHARGAFTGATHARRGRFQIAEGGTLFLDEIGDMPPSVQVKMLRVIQERRYEVLGESQTQAADVRFIAATHRDLERLVAEGTFRQDLFYRLAVVELHLPPLRERQSDIPLLIAHFLEAANATHRRAVTGVSAAALECLARYRWPGNVRELANVMESLVVLRAEGEIRMEDIPARLQANARDGSAGAPIVDFPNEGIDLAQALLQVEGALIEKALDRARGNRTQAAGLLRINRTTLVEKIKRRDDDR